MTYSSLNLFHVEYISGDVLGYILAWSSLIPILSYVVLVTLVFFRRDLYTGCFLFGALVNNALNLVLKLYLKHGRPLKAENGTALSSYGMPSDHTQTIWFLYVFLALFLIHRAQYKQDNYGNVWRLIILVVGFLVAITVSISRVYLQYHYKNQVVLGGVLGSLIAVSYFVYVERILTPVFPVVANSIVGEFLMLRDSSMIPNILYFEYVATRNEAKWRSRNQKHKKSQ